MAMVTVMVMMTRMEEKQNMRQNRHEMVTCYLHGSRAPVVERVTDAADANVVVPEVVVMNVKV
jgi:hypothetical protein